MGKPGMNARGREVGRGVLSPRARRSSGSTRVVGATSPYLPGGAA
jgi:hypothetical protein